MPAIQNQVKLKLDRIVVATDFTPASEVATEYAETLAKHFSSELTIANIVDLSVASRSEEALVGSPVETMRLDSAENMEQVLTRLADGGVHACGQTLEAHNPAAAVVCVADELRADLIVTGTDSHRGLSKMIRGSFADGVIHHATCPVMTLGPRVRKPNPGGLRFKTIVFATDLQHDTAQKAAVALAIAQDSVAKIHMCHVLQHAGKDFGNTIELQLKTESALRELVPDAFYEWCSPEYIVEYGSVGKHLIEIARKTGADLIVLGARRSVTWFTHLVEGVVERVIAEAECPVMTICTD